MQPLNWYFRQVFLWKGFHYVSTNKNSHCINAVTMYMQISTADHRHQDLLKQCLVWCNITCTRCYPIHNNILCFIIEAKHSQLKISIFYHNLTVLKIKYSPEFYRQTQSMQVKMSSFYIRFQQNKVKHISTFSGKEMSLALKKLKLLVNRMYGWYIFIQNCVIRDYIHVWHNNIHMVTDPATVLK